MPILVAAHLVKPLGNPPVKIVKYFAALKLLEQVKDRTWLAKVTHALNQYRQRKNAAKKNGLTEELSKQHSCPTSVTMVAVRQGGRLQRRGYRRFGVDERGKGRLNF